MFQFMASSLSALSENVQIQKLTIARFSRPQDENQIKLLDRKEVYTYEYTQQHTDKARITE